MSELEKNITSLINNIYNALSRSIVTSNIALSQLLQEGVIAGYEIPTDERNIPIVMGCRPCGRGVIIIYIEDVGKIYFMDLSVDSDGEINKILTIMDWGTDDIAEPKWQDLIDEVHDWVAGNVEKIEIPY
jgi:hypothetical protein